MNKISVLLLVTGLVWSLVACGPSPEQQAAMTSTALTAVAAMWTPTASPTHTVTLTPTIPPTPTVTPTPSLTPTPTLTPTRTPDPNRYYSLSKSISLMCPQGWTRFTEETLSGCVGPQMGDLHARIFVYEEQNALVLPVYTARTQDALIPDLGEYKQIGEDFLTTSQGLDYFRWEYQYTNQGTVWHDVVYFFEAGKFKQLLLYRRPLNSGMEFDDLVEAAVQTVHVEIWVTPSPTTTLTKTLDPNRYYPPEMGISLVPPKDWYPSIKGGNPYLYGPAVGNYSVAMVFYKDQDSISLADYAAVQQKRIPGTLTKYKQISANFLTTPAGLDYFRWEFEYADQDSTTQQTLYLFDFDGNKLWIYYSRGPEANPEYAALVEESIKTVRIEK